MDSEKSLGLKNQVVTYKVIGVMSGTSLDGLDLAHCEFVFEDGNWDYRITAAETIPYNKDWKVRLGKLHEQPIFLYPKTDLFYGRYIGQCVNQFITKNTLKPDLIASHGHTIFHQPLEGYTAQIGHGGAIAAITKLPVVNDFRTQDVVLGGQGAPLVPIGDELLFGEYDTCLNLGGIANISFKENGVRKAFDISPCNLPINFFSALVGLTFDNNGDIAREGEIVNELLQKWNGLDFYKMAAPKSLGREWVEKEFIPLANQQNTQNILRTVTEHIAIQIVNVLKQIEAKNVLITGGGARNGFLVERLATHWKGEIIVGDDQLVDFKEALIFGFLGLLSYRNQVNILSSVTGAKSDHISGCVWH